MLIAMAWSQIEDSLPQPSFYPSLEYSSRVYLANQYQYFELYSELEQYKRRLCPPRILITGTFSCSKSPFKCKNVREWRKGSQPANLWVCDKATINVLEVVFAWLIWLQQPTNNLLVIFSKILFVSMTHRNRTKQRPWLLLFVYS